MTGYNVYKFLSYLHDLKRNEEESGQRRSKTDANIVKDDEVDNTKSPFEYSTDS